MYISTSVVFPPGISFAHPKSPRTTQVVGSFNRETNEMDLTDPKLLQEVPVFFPRPSFRGPKMGIFWHILARPMEKSVPGTLHLLMIGRASDAASMAPAEKHRQINGKHHRL